MANRKKKSRVWQIIVGAVLVVAGVVASVFTAGASSLAVVAGVGLLSAAAISYGVSLAMSGIKFEQFKNMIDNDYSKGLKDTVTDGAVYECIGDDIAKSDDTFRWFHDTLNSVYIESSVPFALRDGITAGVVDFVDSPTQFIEDNFRSYIVEKLTTIDRDQGSGRLYKGYATAEFYSMNLDYMRFNKQKVFIHLPIEYDCCADDNESFNTRVWYSEQSFQEERIDNYRVFLPNNYRDIEGEHGEITDLYRLGNALFVHCKEVLWQLPQNLQMATINEIVSFIGTGEFFNVPPRKVIDDNLGSGGTQHKWATVKTKLGVLFVNEIENKIYLHAENLKDISLTGIHSWFKEFLISNLNQQFFEQLGISYPNDNNPANPGGVGYLSAYDTELERILVTKKDYFYLGDFSKYVSYSANGTGYQVGQFFIDDLGFQEITAVSNTGVITAYKNVPFTDKTKFVNKSWTLSYSFASQSWISYHSYLPLYYIHNQESLYSFIGDSNIWKHNIEGIFNSFYNVQTPYIIEYVKVGPGLNSMITEDLTLITKARRWNITDKTYQDERFITFNKLIAYNDRASTGELNVVVKDTMSNPGDWLFHQLRNTPGQILITRRERDWNLNEIRNYVVDPGLPIFSNAWAKIQDNYYIDKVVNQTNIDHLTQWSNTEMLRDKFIIIRLKFDNFDNVNLIFNFSLETEQISNR